MPHARQEPFLSLSMGTVMPICPLTWARGINNSTLRIPKKHGCGEKLAAIPRFLGSVSPRLFRQLVHQPFEEEIDRNESRITACRGAPADH